MMRSLTTFSIWLLCTTSSASSFATPRVQRQQQKQRQPHRRPAFVLTSRGGGGDAEQPTALAATPEATTSAATAVSEENLQLLSERGRQAVQNLLDYDVDGSQAHVYGDWPAAGTEDEGKQQLAEQLADLDESYPGGLAAYLSKARVLLKESAEGVNPFAEFEATVPEGESLSFSSSDDSTSLPFAEAEQLGLDAIASGGGVAFVLVAGGLGERLGYSGIKLSLETNLCTEASYLQFYIEYIQALQALAQQKAGSDKTIQLPLVIMTSGDTDPLTRQLLKDHDNFGLDSDALTIVTQDKVAALQDGQGGLALDEKSRWKIQTKPHGHGDVHQLLFKHGCVEQWQAQGISHVVFLQDTNALVINSILPALGVSVARGFCMNSICIPRLAGEAAGAIAKLEHKTDPAKSLVINVEYNQLDPLLQSQGTGDVPDETGFSPFPGNANNLVLSVPEYLKTLQGEDQGVVLEFVNPKYKDDTKTVFKKPTRLECMMQDIPKLFQKELGEGEAAAKIGFCMFDRWFTFSPAKNALEAGQDTIAGGGTAPGTLSSAESDLYLQNQKKLVWAGAEVAGGDEEETVLMAGIPVTPGPRVVLSPSFALTQQELTDKVLAAKMTPRSSLVLDGPHITLDGLDLDGALRIRAGPETHVTVKDLKVVNEGWTLTDLPADDDSIPETVSIRGYTMTKHETAEYLLDEPGRFVIGADGQVTRVSE